MNKKVIWGTIILLVILAGAALAARFLLGGDEDAWLCQNGSWIKHGNPESEMPTGGCEKNFGPGNYWLCRNGVWEKFGDPTTPMPTGDCGKEGAGAGLANPASVNCLDKGGTEETRVDGNGGQYGVCKFSDGSECDSWKFFRGECKIGDSKK